ncbi:MAG: L,D-transpeptidase [Xanthobacteraceae bacterium]
MRIRHLAFVLMAFSLAGCISDTLDPVPESAIPARDRKLIASAPYLNHKPDSGWLRHLVDYPSKDKPGTVIVDTDKKFLYLIQPNGKAYRYGVTVGEEGMAFKGEAQVRRKAEWPDWTPTPDILKRFPNLPKYVSPGPHNPMGARALYLYQGNKDTLFRIHGTNQPEYIGQAISSGCIRMLNEDVIDLYNRVPQGALVRVL